MTNITKCPPETVSSNPKLRAFYDSLPIVFFCFLPRAEPEATVSAKKPKIDVSSYCLEQGERQLVKVKASVCTCDICDGAQIAV